MNVFDLFAKLTLDKSEYVEGLNTAESEAKGFGSKLATAAKVGTAAVAAVGTATVAMGKKFVSSAKEVSSYGDSIDKLSQKIGISAEAYQEWDFIAQHSGTTMESLKPAFKTLANAAQDGKEAFEELGISIEDAQKMSTEDLFSAVVAGLQDMEEGTKRTAIASDLLGRGALELGALLNTSAKDTEAMRKQVHLLGGVMSDEAVKASANFKDQLQNLSTATSGLKNKMFSEFLPALSTVSVGLSSVFSGDYYNGLDVISKGIDDLVKKSSDIIPKVLEIGAKVIETLGLSIVKNFPKLIPTAVNIILEFANTIVQNLPMLIQTAVEVLVQIITALSKALPQIIPPLIDAIVDSIPVIIDSVINGLFIAMPQIIAGLVLLVVEIVKHIPQIIKALIDIIPRIIGDIIKGFSPLKDRLGEVATNAIDRVEQFFSELPYKLGYWAGEAIASVLLWFSELPTRIEEWFNRTVDKVVDFGRKIKEEIPRIAKQFKDDLIYGIKTLPDNMKWIGRQIVDGLKNGIKEKWEALKKWFSSLGQGLVDGFKNKLGIASPSKVMEKVGVNTGEGYEKGVLKKVKDVKGALSQYYEMDDVNINGSVNGQAATVSPVSNVITLNVYGAEGQNVSELADEIEKRLANKMYRSGRVYA